MYLYVKVKRLLNKGPQILRKYRVIIEASFYFGSWLWVLSKFILLTVKDEY